MFLLKVSGTYLRLFADLPCHLSVWIQLSTYQNVWPPWNWKLSCTMIKHSPFLKTPTHFQNWYKSNNILLLLSMCTKRHALEHCASQQYTVLHIWEKPLKKGLQLLNTLQYWTHSDSEPNCYNTITPAFKFGYLPMRTCTNPLQFFYHSLNAHHLSR